MATETADRILDAACELIAEEGIDEVRIARVAQRARASSTLVHHYFSTREELLEKALVHSFERAGIRAMVADPAMDVEAERDLVTRTLAPLLGVKAEALA